MLLRVVKHVTLQRCNEMKFKDTLNIAYFAATRAHTGLSCLNYKTNKINYKINLHRIFEF